MGNALAVVAVAIFAVLVLFRGAGVVYGLWSIFRESGYPWWIKAPAAITLGVLFWMLNKRDKRGRRIPTV